MMGKVCHTIVNNMGNDKVFLGKNKKRKDKEKIKNNKENVHMAHIHVGVHKGP